MGGFTLDDTEIYEPTFSPVCAYCKHLFQTKHRKCNAFDYIPDSIWFGDNNHKKPVPGDGGIRFEKRN